MNRFFFYVKLHGRGIVLLYLKAGIWYTIYSYGRVGVLPVAGEAASDQGK